MLPVVLLVAGFAAGAQNALAGGGSFLTFPALLYDCPSVHWFVTSLLGGGAGAVLLLATPVSVFTHLVPFLILFATVVFAAALAAVVNIVAVVVFLARTPIAWSQVTPWRSRRSPADSSAPTCSAA